MGQLTEPKCTESDVKKSYICPIWGLSYQLWTQICSPCYQWKISHVWGIKQSDVINQELRPFTAGWKAAVWKWAGFHLPFDLQVVIVSVKGGGVIV